MATPIPYVPRAADVRYGVPEAISPLIRRVTANNPNRFTADGTGTFIDGRGEVAVIDPGPLLDDHVAAVIAALEPGERITHIVVTHTHSDHSPASRPLQEQTGAKTYGFGPHASLPEFDETDRIVFDDPEADDPEGKKAKAKESGEEPEKEGPDTDFAPDVTVADGDRIEGDGWTLEAVHTPGHTSNHLCYSLLEENALFSGDHVMGWSTSVIVPPDGDLNDYLAGLRTLLARDEAVYHPTHAQAITDPKPLVAAYLAHREERTEQILDGLEAGDRTITALVRRMYALYPKALWVPAGLSVHAHLVALVATGTVVADAITDGTPRRTANYALA